MKDFGLPLALLWRGSGVTLKQVCKRRRRVDGLEMEQ